MAHFGISVQCLFNYIKSFPQLLSNADNGPFPLKLSKTHSLEDKLTLDYDEQGFVDETKFNIMQERRKVQASTDQDEFNMRKARGFCQV